MLTDMHNETLNIWKQFDKGLKQYVCSKVNHGEECYDILQNLYLKIDSYAVQVKNARNLPSYLFRMAHHEVINHYRDTNKYELRDVMDFDKPVNDPEIRDGSLKLADCCLRPMIDQLPAIYREALLIADIEGLPHKELARRADISLSAAKVRVQRARLKLKEAILGCCKYEFDTYGNVVGNHSC